MQMLSIFDLLLSRRYVVNRASSTTIPTASIIDLRKIAIVLKGISGHLKTYSNVLLQADIKNKLEH